jgi:deazaflavin-dependent oxidoreductase (nitroreductase family)
MPSDGFFKTMNRAHRVLLKLSGGRLGWTVGHMPVLRLTTTGRRSGTLRSVMLTSPHREFGMFVIVASKGGENTHPAWFLNLLENPQVLVTVKGGVTSTMIARVVSPEERARLWPIVTGKYSNYAGYQARTDREIPLIMLESGDRL